MKFWEELSPKNRRYIVVGAAIGLFSLIMAIMPSGDDSERKKKEEPTVRAILTDDNDPDARFERLVAQIENMRAENKDLQREFERVQRDVKRQDDQGGNAELQDQIRDLEQKISRMKDGRPRQNGNGGTVVVGGDDGSRDQSETGNNAANNNESEGGETIVLDEPDSRVGVQDDVDNVSDELWKKPPPKPAPVEDGGRSSGRGNDNQQTSTTGAMRVIEASAPENPDMAQGEGSEEGQSGEAGVYLPAGSILTGTLVTGMDAPTGQGARQEPFPSLLRVKREAILPNRFRADVRECFVIVGGFGDLSSERAYLRGESISCVRNDGKVVETSLESYTVGEDGKAGLRGRLVSKQGQMLAKATIAGVMEGFAGAFNSSPVPTLSLDAGEQPLYQQAFSEDAVQSGAVSGVGKALDRVAQFYLEQANGMFPVIEIDAGREVEIVLIRGSKLAIK
jgi:conjugal transfer pilus assembly protein TraB